MDTERKPNPPSWVLPIIAVVAVTTMGVGSWLSLKRLAPALQASQPTGQNQPPQPIGDTLPVPDPPSAVHGRKSPRDYALPVYPSAFDFHSMETSKLGGSTAFVVKKGSAAEISRYYIQQLGASGWEYRWKSDTSASPGDPAHPITLKGTRVRWIDWKKRQQLTLLALDDPQKGRTAQAVLSWATVPGLETSGARSRGSGPGATKP